MQYTDVVVIRTPFYLRECYDIASINPGIRVVLWHVIGRTLMPGSDIWQVVHSRIYASCHPAVTPYEWEGNRRSGVALVMPLRLE